MPNVAPAPEPASLALSQLPSIQTGPVHLDQLAALAAADLAPLYRAARTPALAEVTGDLVGRMLALDVIGEGWLARLLRAFARWRFFPWRGKSFSHAGGARGEGINRVFSDRRPRRWFRFETSIGPSRAGSFDALHLDYDNPGNPFFIRVIKDEIRALRPGLYLGQAYLVTRKRARLVLYFALMAR